MGGFFLFGDNEVDRYSKYKILGRRRTDQVLCEFLSGRILFLADVFEFTEGGRE